MPPCKHRTDIIFRSCFVSPSDSRSCALCLHQTPRKFRVALVTRGCSAFFPLQFEVTWGTLYFHALLSWALRSGYPQVITVASITALSRFSSGVFSFETCRTTMSGMSVSRSCEPLLHLDRPPLLPQAVHDYLDQAIVPLDPSRMGSVAFLQHMVQRLGCTTAPSTILVGVTASFSPCTDGKGVDPQLMDIYEGSPRE
ncbi:unnamed protein product [Ixodes pacificus]